MKKLYFVYFIISKKNSLLKSYVGYTNNLKKRIKKHNTGKGAKSTRGRKWRLVYKKKFTSRSDAMKYEYYLKKNIKKRNLLKKKYA